MTDIENKRQTLQDKLDSQKNPIERNRLGQYSTPYPLARQICNYLKAYTGEEIESFLEPSIGTGAFFSALSETTKVNKAVGFEIDEFYYKPTVALWKDHNLELRNRDFLTSVPDDSFSLIVANPPYTRHHHIPSDTKLKLTKLINSLYGVEISGLSGLYIYFIILSTQWLKDGGYSCWLVPSEFLSVNYGIPLKKFLLNNVDLISIHSFRSEDVQFNDALVSSSVLLFRKDHSDTLVKFSWGGDLSNPQNTVMIEKSQLNPKEKWTESFLKHTNPKPINLQTATIGTFFKVKRGIATGDNKFFIVSKEIVDKYNLPNSVLTPVIPPPRNLKTQIYNQVSATHDGLYLLSCNEALDTIKNKYSGLFKYIDNGISKGVNLRANCKNRNIWYGCETRDVAPILVSYMGRNNGKMPVKFILNEAKVTATNSYLMLYPRDEYKPLFRNADTIRHVWETLTLIPEDILCAYGRCYGGGLIKWEPKELESIPCPELQHLLTPINPSLFDTDFV